MPLTSMFSKTSIYETDVEDLNENINLVYFRLQDIVIHDAGEHCVIFT